MRLNDLPSLLRIETVKTLHVEHFICPIEGCREAYSLQVPLTKILWKPGTFRKAKELFDADVELHIAIHNADRANGRFQAWIQNER